MKLVVHNNLSLKVLQEEFQSQYPYLKIELYSIPYSSGENGRRNNNLIDQLTIGEAAKYTTDKPVIIYDSMTVADLENAFLEVFGLRAQIFRKSKGTWLLTSTTDDWSLAKQNRKGKEMNIPVNIIPDKELSYHEQL